MMARHSSQLVAVVGGSGAGKSWFVGRLCELLGEKAGHLRLDDFYLDRSHLDPQRRARLNFDIPHAIDWGWAERVLRDCRSGCPTELPRYDFATHCRLDERVAWSPQPLVFVDGLWLLRRPELRELFALKIFLDTPAALRRRRRLARDVMERGRTARHVARCFRATVAPMHERYVEPQKRWADLVLAQPFQEEQLLELANRLLLLIEAAAPQSIWAHAAFRAELLAHLLEHEYSH
jgi:uridine kinase